MGISNSSIRPRRAILRAGLTIAPAALSANLLRAQSAGDQKQTDAILKADYNDNVKDARELTVLAKSIELDLDNDGQSVLSLSLLKKLDDVEKITKRIRGRIRR